MAKAERELPGRLVTLVPLRAADAPEMLELRLRNQEWLRPREPLWAASFLTLDGQLRDTRQAVVDRAEDRAYAFAIRVGGTLVGRIAASNVVRGVLQNAYVGYFVDQGCAGRGYATESVRLLARFAFGTAGLHRLQAAVMPDNRASVRVLEKAGFRREGMAVRYLRIAGMWTDHLLYALTAEDPIAVGDADL